MVDEKVPEPTIKDLEKKLNEFIMKYQMDIETLNRILSTYEDKISVLENQYHDLSFRFKQFQINLTKSEESL
ncbi:hypothetical protein LCGC14_0368510 [marine sediment metagenome]|uniref:Uncharacterized protein n=1 Tax=marine sediment metagenome TaxID=412755 RepID=A0A0F9TBW6_9ZZZZ